MSSITDFVNQTNAIKSSGGNWVDPRDELFNKPQQVKQTVQQPQDTGLMGFLKSAGQSIGSDFQRVGQGTANAINEFTGGAQRERDANTQRSQGDIQLIKSYGDRIKNAKTPQEKQRYKDALGKITNISGQQDQEFQNRQQDIVEQNDPLKGAAAVGGLGLDVIGGGAGGSILKGGLLKAITRAAGQGALFGGAQGALEPIKEKGSAATAQDIGGNAAVGAGMGAITGGVAGGVGGVGSKLLNRFSKGNSVPLSAMESQATTNQSPEELVNLLRARLALQDTSTKASLGGIAARDFSREALNKQNNLNRLSIFGKNAVSAVGKGMASDASKQAEDASRFNQLARENIQRLADKSSNSGVPIESGGRTSGIMVTPSEMPSFASEGIEYRASPDMPSIPDRFKNMSSFKPVPQGTIPGTESPNITRIKSGGKDFVTTGRPSMLTRAGKRLTENGSGLKAEPTVGGVNKLNQQSEFMSKYTGTPRQQRVAMEKDMGDLSNQVDEILAKNPTPIKGSEVRSQVQQAISDPLKYADVDLNLPGVQKNLESHLTKFEGAKSAKELNDYVKLLNPIAKRAQDKIARGAAVTDKEAAALTAKRAGDEVLSSIPEIKPLKQNMAQIFDVTPQVAKAGEKGIGLPMVSGVSAKSPVQGAKYLQSKIGSIIQKGAKGKVDQKSLANAFAPVSPGANSAAQNTFGALVNPAVSNNAATPQPEQTQTPSLQEAPSPTDVPTGQSQASSIFNKDNVQALVLQDLASNGGKNVSTLLSLYKAFGGEDQAQKPLSSTAATAVGNANSGLNSLQQLEDIISQQGGVSKGTLVPGRDLFGNLGANVLGTASYDTAAKNIQDVITRLRSGAAITPDEAKFYNSQLPSAFDSPDVIAQKTQMFKDLFNSVADRTGGNTTDVQSLVTQ